jgi:hypothetical protein
LIGPFAVSDLETGRARLSPFNIVHTLDAPFFTLDEEKQLFGQFVAERQKQDPSFTLDERIIQHIHEQTAGATLHPSCAAAGCTDHFVRRAPRPLEFVWTEARAAGGGAR